MGCLVLRKYPLLPQQKSGGYALKTKIMIGKQLSDRERALELVVQYAQAGCVNVTRAYKIFFLNWPQNGIQIRMGIYVLTGLNQLLLEMSGGCVEQTPNMFGKK